MKKFITMKKDENYTEFLINKINWYPTEWSGKSGKAQDQNEDQIEEDFQWNEKSTAKFCAEERSILFVIDAQG